MRRFGWFALGWLGRRLVEDHREARRREREWKAALLTMRCQAQAFRDMVEVESRQRPRRRVRFPRWPQVRTDRRNDR